LAIVLVRRIDGRQMALYRRLRAMISADQAPAEPLPTGAPASAAVIVGALLTVAAVIGAGIAYSDGRNPPGQAVGPRSSVGPATLAAGWTEHDDPAGFSMGIPPDWKVRPNAKCCALRADDRTGTIVLVITEPVSAGITLEQYADVLSVNIESGGVVDKVADDERTSLPAGPSIRLSLEGSANGLTIAEVVYVLIDGSNGYTVVFSTPRAALATMLPVFDEMIESLRFTV
jgi:hypothetical protein